MTRQSLLRADLAIKHAILKVEQAQRQGERRTMRYIADAITLAAVKIETCGSRSSQNSETYTSRYSPHNIS
jgi:hypothetical protein